MAKNDKDRGQHFDVGDNFTGLAKIIDDMMMNNELDEGYGAYKISYAGTDNSGLSFGGNQMDMSERPDAVTLLVNILTNAKDTKGNLLVPANTLDKIVKNTNFNEKGKTPEQIFGKNLSLVNSAMSSTYGISEINKQYLVEIKRDTALIETRISQMKNPAAKEFYSTDFGQMLLFDYQNQFGFNDKSPFLHNYINGEYNNKKKVDFTTKEAYAAPTDHYTLADHVKYLHSTEQWAKKKAMVDTRIADTVNMLKAKYKLSEKTPSLMLAKKILFGEDDIYLDDLDGNGWSTADYIGDDSMAGINFALEMADYYQFDESLLAAHWSFSWLPHYNSYMKDFDYIEFLKTIDQEPLFCNDYAFNNFDPNYTFETSYQEGLDFNNHYDFNDNYYSMDDVIYSDNGYWSLNNDDNYYFRPYDFDDNFNCETFYFNEYNLDYINYTTDYTWNFDTPTNTDYDLNWNINFDNNWSDYTYWPDYTTPIDYGFNSGFNFGGGGFYFNTFNSSEKPSIRLSDLQDKKQSFEKLLDRVFAEENNVDLLESIEPTIIPEINDISMPVELNPLNYFHETQVWQEV